MAGRHPYPTAAAFVPDTGDLAALARAALGCQGCDIYQQASQTVFGEGAADAAVVLIGEQPGDMEDRQGKPFVGPAGRLLDRALGDAGISHDRAYLTNAVKHFRWRPAPGGGKRRIHQPDGDELTVVPTVHPSSVIRVQGSERDEAYAGFVKDLQAAAALLT